MDVNHRGRGRVPAEFGVGNVNANCPLDFVNVSRLQAPDSLHYNAVKAYQPHNCVDCLVLYYLVFILFLFF